MCEGLLNLTVDRIFPAASPSASNVGVDERIFASDTHASIEATGAGSSSKVQRQPAPYFGNWRPITMAPPFISHDHNQPEASCSSDARGGVKNPSAQMFSLTGRRLTRRSLARAERGVRQATAVKVIAAWWRSIADECRKARSIKLRAMAQISAWVVELVARRRRKALLSKSERSARAIQALWRRATEARSLAARVAACVVVQTVWRQWQYKRRCASRRVRRKVFSGLKSWARLLLSHRQDMARKTILRAVTVAMTRHASKRHAAATIMRWLEATFLLRIRLAALSQARVDRVRSRAATIIARAFRRARSATVRADLAARTLQSWSRRVLLWRRGKRFMYSAIIQRAWRLRKTRQLLAEARRPSLKGATEAIAAKMSTAINVQGCAVDPGKLAAADRAAVLDASGSQNVGQLDPRNQINSSVPPTERSGASHCSPPGRPMERNKTHSLRVPTDGEHQVSSALRDQFASPATTARENWSDPDLCLVDGGAQSFRSRASGGGSLSYNESHCAMVVTAPGSSPLSGRSTPRTTTTTGAERVEVISTDESFGGILDLENILPDFIKRRQSVAPLERNKYRGCSAVSRQSMKFKSVQNRPIAEGPRALGDGRVMPACSSRGRAGLPYPPARGTRPIGSRARWSTRRWARTRGDEGRAGVAVGQAPEASDQGYFHSMSRRSPGRRTAAKGDDHRRLGWNWTPAAEGSFGRACANSSCSRAGPSSRRASAKKRVKRGMGARGAGDSLGSSGGVLGMLAFMEA